MYIVNRLQFPFKQVWTKLDPASLRVRLTVGVATVAALGLGSVAVWMSLRMQHLLIASHKQNLQYIANRLPHDIEIYSDMVSLDKGMLKAIDNLTDSHTLFWVKNDRGKVIAQSVPMKVGIKGKDLTILTQIPANPQLQQVNGRHWLLCSSPLVVKNTNLGQVYIAQDITDDRAMFLQLIKNLGLASLLAIGSMIVLIAWYIQRSLKPLQRLGEITRTISADELGKASIDLKNASSEVRDLAGTFEEMLSRLSQAWEHQRELVSNVSHELRTPLTIVSGYLQSILRRENNLTPPQREALEIAVSEADRTIQLLQDLLDLARADNGRMYIHLEPIVLNHLLEETIDMGRQYSDRRINSEVPPQLITIKADPNRLKQVILNLVDNAVNYSDPDTPISIRLEHQKEQAILQVCDRGIGISLPHQTRIFERFYRVDEARSRNTGGAGLGLSIVKTLVESMGGTITVHSKPHQGSTFTLTFPVVS